MAYTTTNLFSLLSLHFLLFFAPSSGHRPHAIVAPLFKDSSTHQYLTRLIQRTPLVSPILSIDLSGHHLWVDCFTNYVSSTYRPAPCGSSHCSLADSISCGSCFSSPRPGCNNNTCGAFPENPFTRTVTGGELALDALTLIATDGSNLISLVRDPDFLFSCAPAFLTRGLATNAVGIAGLGRNRIALPEQLAARFSFRRRFALCLPSSPRGIGVMFFGPGPYRLLLGIDASQSLIYTPLLTNPISTSGSSVAGEPSIEYFIGVTAIKVGETAIRFNRALLRIDRKTGYGGTKISTSTAYTTVETTIYKALTAAFATALEKVARVPAVAPFEVCFNGTDLGSTRVGPAVPTVDLVLQKKGVFWRIFGANSMVEVKEGVLCLGFLDGGRKPRTTIVIGGYQLENNLVEFDLAYSRVGFSSTLLFRQTTCSNFNFTTR